MENKSNKKIFITIGAVIVIAVLYFAVRSISFAPSAEENPINGNEINATTTKPIEKTNSDSPKQNPSLPLTNSQKDIAWAVFQKYLSYNKNLNLERVKSIVYKVSPVCSEIGSTTECNARMKSAYAYGDTFKKDEFVNVWGDEKQIILATDFWTESSTDLDQYGRFRSIIFFIKGTDGQWKLLSFSPTAGGAVNKGSASQREVDDRLVRYTDDKDQDGMPDYDEECLRVTDKSTCIQTNPKLRDTDGDGLWDGVEALMK